MAEIHAENVVRERSISRIQRRRPRPAPPPPSPQKTAPLSHSPNPAHRPHREKNSCNGFFKKVLARNVHVAMTSLPREDDVTFNVAAIWKKGAKFFGGSQWRDRSGRRKAAGKAEGREEERRGRGGHRSTRRCTADRTTLDLGETDAISPSCLACPTGIRPDPDWGFERRPCCSAQAKSFK